jgi:hypothetical protein
MAGLTTRDPDEDAAGGVEKLPLVRDAPVNKKGPMILVLTINPTGKTTGSGKGKKRKKKGKGKGKHKKHKKHKAKTVSSSESRCGSKADSADERLCCAKCASKCPGHCGSGDCVCAAGEFFETAAAAHVGRDAGDSADEGTSETVQYEVEVTRNRALYEAPHFAVVKAWRLVPGHGPGKGKGTGGKREPLVVPLPPPPPPRTQFDMVIEFMLPVLVLLQQVLIR